MLRGRYGVGWMFFAWLIIAASIATGIFLVAALTGVNLAP